MGFYFYRLLRQYLSLEICLCFNKFTVNEYTPSTNSSPCRFVTSFVALLILLSHLAMIQ